MKIKLEEAKIRLKEKHGNKIEILEYIRMNDKAKFKCVNCGYEWVTNASSVINCGCGCDRCADRRNGDKGFLSYDYIRNYFEEFNCQLISEEYRGRKKKLDIIFSCGHRGYCSFASFKQMESKICRNCKEEIIRISRRMSSEDVIALIESKEFKFIKFNSEYKNQTTKVTYECKFGHSSTRPIMEFKVRPNCKECSRIKMSITQMGEKSVNWKGGLSNLSKLLNKRIKDWKQEVIKKCDYCCVISGDNFHDIHHLFSFNILIRQTLEFLNFPVYRDIGSYTSDELIAIVTKLQELHKDIDGVCLRKDIHILFHRYYGNRENYPWQFEEFKSRIASGEIQIN